MALREIRLYGDPILRKKSKVVTEINDRIIELLDDMVETMAHANGAGLAAPQVGVLRRVIVIDVGEGPIKIINPVISESRGEILDIEGCLSIPLRSGTVKRPEWVKMEYLNESGTKTTLEGTGLLARAICHEIDHLDGILYTDIAIETFDDSDEKEEEFADKE